MYRFLIILIVLCSCLLSGCKKEIGCTDKTALNYSSLAKTDDGSCRYCLSSFKDTITVTRNLRDLDTGSIHFDDFVCRFKTDEIVYAFNDVACDADFCDYKITISNLVSEEIEFNYLLILSGSGDSLYGHVLLSAGQSITRDFPRKRNTCAGTGGPLYVTDTIQYH